MLDYDLDERGSVSLYEYLYQRIRDDILSGSIVAGEHLPSKRGLAQHLGISVITVEGAYDQLVAEGFVRSVPRRGYFANELPRAATVPRLKDAADRDAGSVAPGRAFVPVSDLPKTSLDGARLWQRALKAVLASESERELFAPAPAQGTARLRRAIAAHLRGSRGMDVDPEAIVIGAGAQLLDTMLVQLLGREKTYAVEDPGYLRLTRIYQACGCDVYHIPLDAEGPDLRELEESGADVLHLMPSHQFPTGRVTSIARRYALLGWASQRSGRYLIEDDFDCEFRLAGKPIPPLAAIDAPGCVIYTNTFSKSLSSALRLAYMVLPDRLMGRYRQELGFYASTVSSIDQIVLAHLLETGGGTNGMCGACASAYGMRATLWWPRSPRRAWRAECALRAPTPASMRSWPSRRILKSTSCCGYLGCPRVVSLRSPTIFGVRNMRPPTGFAASWFSIWRSRKN